MNRVYWTRDYNPINTTVAKLIYDLRRDEEEDLIMDAVTERDFYLDADERLTFDALITPYNRIERKMQIMRRFINRAGTELKVREDAPDAPGLEITDPFKRNGTAQVAAIFYLTDGQTITILFHNPDTTPSKIAPTDELISWKWMINKKDVTVVVAPEHGKDLDVNEVARRIMKLAEKNSKAFQRANAKRAERLRNLEANDRQIADLEAQLKKAEADLEAAKVECEDTQKKRDEAKKAAEGRAKKSEEEWQTAPLDTPEQIIAFAEKFDGWADYSVVGGKGMRLSKALCKNWNPFSGVREDGVPFTAKFKGSEDDGSGKWSLYGWREDEDGEEPYLDAVIEAFTAAYKNGSLKNGEPDGQYVNEAKALSDWAWVREKIDPYLKSAIQGNVPPAKYFGDYVWRIDGIGFLSSMEVTDYEKGGVSGNLWREDGRMMNMAEEKLFIDKFKRNCKVDLTPGRSKFIFENGETMTFEEVSYAISGYGADEKRQKSNSIGQIIANKLNEFGLLPPYVREKFSMLEAFRYDNNGKVARINLLGKKGTSGVGSVSVSVSWKQSTDEMFVTSNGDKSDTYRVKDLDQEREIGALCGFGGAGEQWKKAKLNTTKAFQKLYLSYESSPQIRDNNSDICKFITSSALMLGNAFEDLGGKGVFYWDENSWKYKGDQSDRQIDVIRLLEVLVNKIKVVEKPKEAWEVKPLNSLSDISKFIDEEDGWYAYDSPQGMKILEAIKSLGWTDFKGVNEEGIEFEHHLLPDGHFSNKSSGYEYRPDFPSAVSNLVQAYENGSLVKVDQDKKPTGTAIDTSGDEEDIVKRLPADIGALVRDAVMLSSDETKLHIIDHVKMFENAGLWKWDEEDDEGGDLVPIYMNGRMLTTNEAFEWMGKFRESYVDLTDLKLHFKDGTVFTPSDLTNVKANKWSVTYSGDVDIEAARNIYRTAASLLPPERGLYGRALEDRWEIASCENKPNEIECKARLVMSNGAEEAPILISYFPKNDEMIVRGCRGGSVGGRGNDVIMIDAYITDIDKIQIVGAFGWDKITPEVIASFDDAVKYATEHRKEINSNIRGYPNKLAEGLLNIGWGTFSGFWQDNWVTIDIKNDKKLERYTDGTKDKYAGIDSVRMFMILVENGSIRKGFVDSSMKTTNDMKVKFAAKGSAANMLGETNEYLRKAFLDEASVIRSGYSKEVRTLLNKKENLLKIEQRLIDIGAISGSYMADIGIKQGTARHRDAIAQLLGRRNAEQFIKDAVSGNPVDMGDENGGTETGGGQTDDGWADDKAYCDRVINGELAQMGDVNEVIDKLADIGDRAEASGDEERLAHVTKAFDIVQAAVVAAAKKVM